jgi:hypothetical protein
MPEAEQLGRNHAITVKDRPFAVTELPQERSGAHPDQEIGDDRHADRRIVITDRDGKDHAEPPPVCRAARRARVSSGAH